MTFCDVVEMVAVGLRCWGWPLRVRVRPVKWNVVVMCVSFL